MLEIKNLTKIYGGKFKAVDDLSITVKDGEIYGFIGHNGAGKSTTIKAVTGVLKYEEGEIFIDGKNIKKEPIECKKLIAYIPDNPDIYDNMTGIQYLNFICDIYRVCGKERTADIEKYAEMFEIKNNLGDLISSYSHGMKQKLVLISAFIHNPKLIILDEPFVGLDPIASFKLKGLMREFCDRGGAIFFSTHVLEVAEKLCDRVGIIKKGKLVAEGTVAEVTGDKSLESIFIEIEESSKANGNAKDEGKDNA